MLSTRIRNWTIAASGAVGLVGSFPAGAAETKILDMPARPHFSAVHDCTPGAYRSEREDLVLLSRDQQPGFFYSFVDGPFGRTTQHDRLVNCSSRAVFVKRPTGAVERWQIIPIKHTPVQFSSGGTTLTGMLIEPVEAQGKKAPLVIPVHGSFTFGWLDEYMTEYYFLAAQGINVFVFDKRGAGESAGKYTQDFHLLARDVEAASREAKRLMAGKYGRFGFLGLSQGGWVGPLAAKGAGVDFLAIAFAGIFSPVEEESEEVLLGLREKGFGEDVTPKARQALDATGAVLASNFTSGYERLREVKQLYGREPWFQYIVDRRESKAGEEGYVTGDLLVDDEPELRARGAAKYNSINVPWGHESMPVLRGLSVPILWVLAGSDRESVPRLTLGRLATLQKEGKRIDAYVFPDTDHNILDFEEAPDGTRTYTGVAPGYYRMVADWIKGKWSPPYGRAKPLGR